MCYDPNNVNQWILRETDRNARCETGPRGVIGRLQLGRGRPETCSEK
jgi:hypothetical protein